MKTCRAALFTLAAVTAAFAVNAEPDTSTQLRTIEQDLHKSQALQERLHQEHETVSRNLEHVREQRVALAKEIQDQEYSIELLENRIAGLESAVNHHSVALGRRDQQMRQVLLALERLALHPADALMVSPLAPDDAVRAAILLRAAVPEILISSATLQGELAPLYQQRAELVAQREQVAADAAQLAQKRLQLDGLIERTSARQSAVASQSADMDAKVESLSQKAENLRTLFAKLEAEKARRGEQVSPAEAGRTEQSVTAAGQPPGETSPPERLFSQARGTLPFPAVGKITTHYEETVGGQVTKGITIATLQGATVISPFDGTVVFAGPFRGYGNLVIVEHSEGYHTLMAGLGRLDAHVGQQVLAGEPVGVMADDGRPTLYVELRHDGRPINPLPWLTAPTGTPAQEATR